MSANPERIGFELIQRLSDPAYLISWAERFKRIADSIGSFIENEIQPRDPLSPVGGKKIPPEVLGKFDSSIENFTRFILNSIIKNLNLLISIESELAISKSTLSAWHRAWETSDLSKEDDPEVSAIQQLIKLAVSHEDPASRARALSAIVYFLKEDDVLPDSEEFGSVDDQFVMSKVLSDGVNKGVVSPQVASWASRVIGNADAVMPRPLQEHISREFEGLVERIETLSIQSASRDRPKEMKTKRP
ncbi:MAG: hypothetical protein KDM63_10700 [Verrucomicrobiae bacterium]|nr:hypothetical protein [Verrucomicrobiae bacterium]